jgi:integrase
MTTSYDFQPWEIRKRSDRKKPWEVRWAVGGASKSKSKSFLTKALADAYRAKLMAAARAGEEFDTATGEPVTWAKAAEPAVPEEQPVTWFEHACDFVAMKWPHIAARNRVNVADSLATVTPVLVDTLQGMPEQKVLRKALYKFAFNLNSPDPEDWPSEITAALRWVEQHSIPVHNLSNAAVVRKALGAISLKMDGKASAAATYQRKRALFYNCLGYAVELELLGANPIDKVQWTADETERQIDRRVVANPNQVDAIVETAATRSKRGNHLKPFYSTVYYAGTRPSEVRPLEVQDCTLPEPTKSEEWGQIELGASTPYAGKAWTDDGEAFDERHLKARSINAVRTVPIPPKLVAILRKHIEDNKLGPTDRLFSAIEGGYISPAEYGKIWREARAATLTGKQAASPLAKRVYDLRHGNASLLLNAGVTPTEVARRLGHSVAVLLQVYAGCLDGEEETANERIDEAFKRYEKKASSKPTEPASEQKPERNGSES